MDEVIKEQAREIMSGMFRKPIHEGVNAIASAIAGERKRCAEAVHRVAKDFYGNTDQMHAAALILSEIEAGA